MTDEQIKKALECCSTWDRCQSECPYDGKCDDIFDCTTRLAKDALALIKRQKEEIARARAEAIREFAERLDGYLTVNCTIEKNAVKSSIADDDICFHGGKEIAFADVKQRIISILQEMTEEQK